jgi:hypothetical protein
MQNAQKWLTHVENLLMNEASMRGTKLKSFTKREVSTPKQENVLLSLFSLSISCTFLNHSTIETGYRLWSIPLFICILCADLFQLYPAAEYPEISKQNVCGIS